MTKLKKIAKCLFLIFILICSPLIIKANANAEVLASYHILPVAKPIKNLMSPKVVQTVWYYRIYEGKQQKRLWYITDQKWLTEWMDC